MESVWKLVLHKLPSLICTTNKTIFFVEFVLFYRLNDRRNQNMIFLLYIVNRVRNKAHQVLSNNKKIFQI